MGKNLAWFKVRGWTSLAAVGVLLLGLVAPQSALSADSDWSLGDYGGQYYDSEGRTYSASTNIGLPVGERHVFLLEPDQAFGAHNPQLVQRIARADLPRGSAPELYGSIEFAGPGGGKFSGMVRELDDSSVLVDFNHPLAGKQVRFEVQVLGIL